MTDAQKKAVSLLMQSQGDVYEGGRWQFHHGCCTGADEDAHHIARDLGAFIVGHPGPYSEYSSKVKCGANFASEPYFKRNRIIVQDCDVLIATPRLMVEEPKGGTWYTIRYARKVGKYVYVVWPDGSVTQ